MGEKNKRVKINQNYKVKKEQAWNKKKCLKKGQNRIKKRSFFVKNRNTAKRIKELWEEERKFIKWTKW